MSWESFFAHLMRDELFFIFTAVTVAVGIIAFVSFLLFRVCKVALKFALVVLVCYAAVLMLMQVKTIADKMPVVVSNSAKMLPRNFSIGESFYYVQSVWESAKQTYDGLSWISEIQNSGTEASGTEANDTSKEEEPTSKIIKEPKRNGGAQQKRALKRL